MFIPRHLAFFGYSIYMLLLVAFIILIAEKVGEHGGRKITRKFASLLATCGAALVIAVNGILFFDVHWALLVLRFDLLFFVLVPPFCFGLWEKAK